VIDWEDRDSPILLNPRLPDADAAAIRALIARIPLEAHVWVTTSGATSRLKPVALAKRAILASAAAVNAHLVSDAADTWVNVLPPFHVGGLAIHARAHLSGARVTALDGWDPATYVAVLGDARRAISSLVPTQVYDLMRAGLRAPPSVRAVVVGGGALGAELYGQARALGWPLLPSYGATECASQIATAGMASLDAHAFPALDVLPHAEVRCDREGRIAVQSAALFSGYATPDGLDDPKRDGWWLSDDVGELRASRLTVWGRADATVKVGGELVPLPPLDARLEQVRLAVAPQADAALVALPDARLGHAVHLAVAGVTDAVAERLLAAFNEGLLPYERARSLRRVAEIPRTALGKVRREELVQRAAGSGQR
jgi:O-succinylbenzoic acid--CoA ligase